MALGLLLGDTHGAIGDLNTWPERVKEKLGVMPDFALQVGDFGFYDGEHGRHFKWPNYRDGRVLFKIPTIVVPGNHECTRTARKSMNPGGPLGEKIKNFKCLTEGEIFEFMGVRILGCGGAYCVDNPPKNEKYEHSSQVFLRAAAEWEKAGSPPIDILLTHEAPTNVGIMSNPWVAKKYNLPPNHPVGDGALRILWETVRPRWQINGHHHCWNWHVEGPDGAPLHHVTLPVSHKGAAIICTDTWQIVSLGEPQ